MRLSIMQPYFFPYLGYFSLIASTEQFVVFDPVQYIRHGWINRNRILKPSLTEAQYILVPLAKHSRATAIRDIRISRNGDWQRRIVAQLQHYKRTAPYFNDTLELVQECLNVTTTSIVELNTRCLKLCCEAIGVAWNPIQFGEIESQVGPVMDAGEWALQISSTLGASVYANPLGGVDIFDPVKFSRSEIRLEFIKNNLSNYPQGSPGFQPALSIIDVLMFNGFEETYKLVNDYEVISPAQLG